MGAQSWTGKWIGPAYDPRQDLGVFAFRRKLELDQVPAELLVRVSADNRYKLYVNEQLVEFGPQRGEPRHWFYETIDLAAYLKPGVNVIWALVWNFGYMAPMAQLSVRTGFVLDADEISTPGGWEVAPLDGWGFDMLHNKVDRWYIDVGPGELIDGRKYPDFHRIGGIDELPWRVPNVISSAEDRGAVGGGTPWNLVPRSVPPMKYDLYERAPVLRRGDGREVLSLPLKIGAGTTALLDFEELLCAYPRYTLRGAPGVRVRATYAEGLWNPDGTKGNRDEVAGKEIQGYQDEFVLGGGDDCFEPLWWRTFRYIQLECDADVELVRVDALETGYPLSVEASFTADHPWTEPIWNVGVRTLERCMGETYFDCPYYEQLQYVGDTRIQALLTYYLTRDRDLPRNAVETLAWSLMENGLTQSRYPSRQTQIIPPFSLWWVLMIRDQVLYDRLGSYDTVQRAEIQTILPAIERLSQTPDESFWNFCDWVPEWRWGVPPSGINATVHKLCWFLALAAHMQAVNPGEEAQNAARMMLRSKLNREFYSRRGLVCHENDQDWEPSEHAEALYRLCQSSLGIDPAPWPEEALDHAGGAKCTYYFSYYKHHAMMPADYFETLKPWREMIESGLTTFAENPEPTRSDCHAWSAHPLLGFFQIVAGVTSIAPGWSKARICPRPGSLRRFEANVAHPDGELIVRYSDGQLFVDTPVPAEVHWRGKAGQLEPGSHRLTVDEPEPLPSG